MRIFFSKSGDPMLLDSRDSLATLHRKLTAFLEPTETEFSAASDTDGDPAPYDKFLSGLRVRKSSGPIALRHGADGWLELSGSIANLKRYVSFFDFESDVESGHHHPEHVDKPDYFDPRSMNLIIEADSSWGALRDVVPKA